MNVKSLSTIEEMCWVILPPSSFIVRAALRALMSEGELGNDILREALLFGIKMQQWHER